MIFKIIGIAIITIVVSAFVKRQNSEIGTIVSLVGGLIISLLLIDEGKRLLDDFIGIENNYNIGSGYVLTAIKILGIAYLTELASDLAEDSGNRFLSNKIILGGKVGVLIVSINVIKNVLETIAGLLW